jgi:hypothetical protein
LPPWLRAWRGLRLTCSLRRSSERIVRRSQDACFRIAEQERGFDASSQLKLVQLRRLAGYAGGACFPRRARLEAPAARICGITDAGASRMLQSFRDVVLQGPSVRGDSVGKPKSRSQGVIDCRRRRHRPPGDADGAREPLACRRAGSATAAGPAPSQSSRRTACRRYCSKEPRDQAGPSLSTDPSGAGTTRGCPVSRRYRSSSSRGTT